MRASHCQPSCHALCSSLVPSTLPSLTADPALKFLLTCHFWSTMNHSGRDVKLITPPSRPLAIHLDYCSSIQMATEHSVPRLCELSFQTCECVHNLDYLVINPSLKLIHIDITMCDAFRHHQKASTFKGQHGMDLSDLRGFISEHGPSSVQIGACLASQYKALRNHTKCDRAAHAARLMTLESDYSETSSDSDERDEEEFWNQVVWP